MEINPENKCADLFEEMQVEKPLHEMFKMQLELQRNLFKRGKGLDYDNATFKERVDQMSKEWRNISLEFAEMLERLPFKEWKTYDDKTLAGFTSDEQELETKYEYIDMFHFFLNIGLLLGIDADEFVSLYLTKNKENFDRQKRGY